MENSILEININSDPFSIAQPGSSRENFFLKGLGYKITVKSIRNIESLYLYSSDIYGDEAHRFSFTQVSSTVWEYIGQSGEDGDATGIEVISALDDETSYLVIEQAWDEGICFNLRIKAQGQGFPSNLGIKDFFFWVRNPTDFILINRLNYQRQENNIKYPILVDRLTVPIEFGHRAKTSQGTSLFGGVDTVEIFNTSGYTGMIDNVSETAIEDISTITLLNRDSGDKLVNFVIPPGYPDFSNYYYLITFRFRAKQASAYYVDIPVILFAAAECAGDGGVGYDSSGDKLPAPTDTTFEIIMPPGIPPSYPPPVCSSTTTLTTSSGSFNPYASKTEVYIYDAASGGNLLAHGEATVTDSSTLEVMRADLETDSSLSDMVEGYAEVVQYSPDRTSTNRTEIIVYGCTIIPIPTITVTPPSTPEEPTTTTIPGDPEREFDPEEKYVVIFRPDKDSGEGEIEITAEVTEDGDLKFEIPEDLDGWIKIIEGETGITPWTEVDIEVYESYPFLLLNPITSPYGSVGIILSYYFFKGSIISYKFRETFVNGKTADYYNWNKACTVIYDKPSSGMTTIVFKCWDQLWLEQDISSLCPITLEYALASEVSGEEWEWFTAD